MNQINSTHSSSDGSAASGRPHAADEHDSFIVRFAGDSGDGMQLTGDRLACVSAILGQEVVTFADFPAEIRAPQGTTYGVSGYQVHIGKTEILTPGDEIDLLVAMNAAALVVNLASVKRGGMILLNEDGFDEKNFQRAGLSESPINEALTSNYRVVLMPMTKSTMDALAETELSKIEKARCKNFFALGLVSWLLDRPFDLIYDWIRDKFSKVPDIARANQLAFKEGHTQGEVRELFSGTLALAIEQHKGLDASSQYRFVGGNTALVYGLLAAREKAGKKLFFGSYPITPASDILHELSRFAGESVVPFQAEDEMAACGAAVGAAFSGALAVTSTSGPGMILKQEFIALGVTTELPLVILDIQRAGPSTGMPTKTEQADLNLALYGRNGEAPLVVIAPQSPADCFKAAFEACNIALRYMTPVVVLSEAYLANGNESWRIPHMKDLPDIDLSHLEKPPTEGPFMPFVRDPKTLARSWRVPGTPGFEHRIGGLEKEEHTGKVSYDGDNHQRMTELRREKVNRVKAEYAPTEVFGPSSQVAILSWGGCFGAARKACQILNQSGSIDHIHLRYLNPLPDDLEAILGRYKTVVVVENNGGQLLMKLRFEYPQFHFEGLQRMTGRPIKISYLVNALKAMLEDQI